MGSVGVFLIMLLLLVYLAIVVYKAKQCHFHNEPVMGNGVKKFKKVTQKQEKGRKSCDPMHDQIVHCKTNDMNACKMCKGHFSRCIPVGEFISSFSTNNDRLRAEGDVQSNNETMYDGYCLPVLPNDKLQCFATTGFPVYAKLHESDNFYRKMCKCKYPGLVGSISPFHNCDQIYACKPHGRFVGDLATVDPMVDGRCACSHGYKPFEDIKFGPTCIPKQKRDIPPCYPFIMKTDGSCSCGPNFVTARDIIAMNETLKSQFSPEDLKRCFMNPCKFDARTRKVLKYAELVKIRGVVTSESFCKCNPNFGNFPTFMNVGGKNKPIGCMNIYGSEKQVRFEERTNFLVPFNSPKNEPQCTLSFPNVPANNFLSPNEKSVGKVEIEIQWPYTWTNINLNSSLIRSQRELGVIGGKHVLTWVMMKQTNWRDIIENLYGNENLTISECKSEMKQFSSEQEIQININFPTCEQPLSATIVNVSYRADSPKILIDDYRPEVQWTNFLFFPICMEEQSYPFRVLVINPHLSKIPSITLPHVIVFNENGLQRPQLSGSTSDSRLVGEFSKSVMGEISVIWKIEWGHPFMKGHALLPSHLHDNEQILK